MNLGANIQELEKGVQQVINAVGSNSTNIGVLVTDSETWSKLSNSTVYKDRLNNLYERLIDSGANLKLIDGLHEESTRGMHGLKDAAKSASEEEEGG